MFRAAYRSSSGALTVFAASGLHTHVVTRRSQVWVGTGRFPLRLDYGRSPHAYINQRLQIHLELLMMSGLPLETCWAFNEQWNNKFCYKVISCWLFLLNHTTILLLQLLTQATPFFVATMCFVWKPSHAICYHKHTLSCLPDVLSQTHTVLSSRRAICATSRHTYHNSSQRPFVHFTFLAIYSSHILIPIFSEWMWTRKPNFLPR